MMVEWLEKYKLRPSLWRRSPNSRQRCQSGVALGQGAEAYNAALMGEGQASQ